MLFNQSDSTPKFYLGLTNEKKREMFSNQPSSQVSKKIKTESSSSVPFNVLRRPPMKVHTPTSPSLNRPERWEEVAIEVYITLLN